MSIDRRIRIALVVIGALALVGIGAGAALLLNGDTGEERTQASPETGTGKGYLGLTIAFAPNQGLRVATVETNGPAAQAGIQVGDIIRSVDGQVLRTPEQLRSAVEAKAPGSQVTLTYERGDAESQARVKLGEAPQNAQVESTPAAPNLGQGQNRGQQNPLAGGGQLGLQIAQVTPALKQQYNLSRDSGVVVTAVQPNSGAAGAGVRPGDIILAVADRPVASVEEATRAVTTARNGQMVSLQLLRGTAGLTVQVPVQSAALPGLDNLPPQIQALLRSGALSPDQLQQLQRFAMTSNGNNLRFGPVKEITSSSIVITPLEGGADVKFALTSLTEVRRGGDRVEASTLTPGANVMIVSVDGQAATAIIAFGR